MSVLKLILKVYVICTMISRSDPEVMSDRAVFSNCNRVGSSTCNIGRPIYVGTIANIAIRTNEGIRVNENILFLIF